MNLILLEANEILPDGRATLSGPRARHMREILKISQGQEVRIGVVDGPTGTAKVLEDAGELRLLCSLANRIPPVPRVDLLLAMPRPKVMNRLWPVLASMGVGRILISNAWKTERNYFDTHVLNPEHIRAGLIEGLQQARDTRLPRVSVHRQFKKLVEDELDNGELGTVRLVAHPSEGPFPFAKLAALSADERVLLAVGPEGGWTPFELELMVAHGFAPISWGERTLRTDTACSALLGAIGAALKA